MAWFARCLVIFSFLEDKCKDNDRLFRGWKIILVFCNSVVACGEAGTARCSECVCIKRSILLNNPDLRH